MAPYLGKDTSVLKTKLKETFSNTCSEVKFTHYTRKTFNGIFKAVTIDQEKQNFIISNVTATLGELHKGFILKYILEGINWLEVCNN